MPYGQVRCGCNICRYQYKPINGRIAKKHVSKYGKYNSPVEDSASPSSSPLKFDVVQQIDGDEKNTKPILQYDRLSTELSTQDEDEIALLDNDGSSRLCDSDHGAITHEETAHEETKNDQESEEKTNGSHFNEPKHCMQNDNECFMLSDVHEMSGSGDSEFESENSDSEDERWENDGDQSDTSSADWSFKYDTNLYTYGIAVEKLPDSDLTLLQWLAMNFLLFTSHPSFSKETFTDNLRMQKRIQKDINDALPSSYYEARKMIEPYLVKKIKYDVCINDCVVFRNNIHGKKIEYAELRKCPVCEQDRFVAHKASKNRDIPRRTFIYIPIGPRLARIYGESNLAKIVQSHPGCDYEGNEMFDIHHSPVWKSLYSPDGYFKGDKMGISLALELDGVNPYHNIGVIYSMTPIMITILNFPRHIRNAFGNIQLVGIIPSSKGESVCTSQQDTYLDILVDELLALTECEAFSAYHTAPVKVKIKLLLYILDYPGLSKLFKQHGSGSLSGCHWCEVQGVKCKHLDKVIYLSNRSFLPENDPLRKDTSHFTNKVIDKSQKPKARNITVETSYRKAYELAKNKTQSSIIAMATGCKGTYALARLPHHNRVEESQPDACHTVKDVTQNVVNLITGRNVNLEKIIRKEESEARLHVIDVSARNNVELNPPKAKKRKSSQSNVYPFLLTKEEVKLADERASCIRPPISFGLKPCPFFSKPGSLKSHDWKQIATQGVLKFCLKDTLSDQCRETLYNFVDSISDLCEECHTLDEIGLIEAKLNKALAYLERDFPLSLQNVTTHILHHIPQSIRLYGPVYSTWMYVFERFNSWLCKRTLNMRYPEATAIETFIIHDWCEFMVSTGRIPGKGVMEHELYNINDAEDIQEATSDAVGVSRPFIPKKRNSSVIHRICNKTCKAEDCLMNKYFVHREQHPKTKRVSIYSCAAKEKASAKTISSYICFENDRGNQHLKLSSGKFLVLGKIQHKNERLNSLDHIAYINCFSNCSYDSNTGLWKAKEEPQTNAFVHVKKLSVPLLTAKENDWIWFLNSKMLPY